MVNEKLTEKELRELWQIVCSFKADEKPFDDVLAESGQDITAALFLAKYKYELGDWDRAKNALYAHSQRCGLLTEWFKSYHLERMKMAGFLLEKIGTVTFDTICEKIDPLAAYTLFFALNDHENSGFHELLHKLNNHKQNWIASP